MKDVKKDILWRVYLVYFSVLLFSLGIIGKAAYIQFVEGEELVKKSEENDLRYVTIKANRGNILSTDGSFLATSIPIFEIRMDVDSEHISDKYFNEKVDSLAFRLSQLFGNKSKYQYKKILTSARAKGNRYLLLKRRVTYDQLKEIRTFPILRKGKFRGGLIIDPKTARKLPYKELAKRTIGYENEKEDIHVGLEGAYGDVLTGQHGQELRRRINNGDWMPVFDEKKLEPRNGKDIVTTIDINIQDVAEDALMEHLKEHEAFQGCVVLMEVQTGEIRAIANLQYDSVLKCYKESYNCAIAESVEPGSTFKLASMIAALESGKISLNDSLITGDGWWVYHRMTIQDVHKIGNGRVTYREVFEESSNVGTSKMIVGLYEEEPQKFIDIIQRMSLDQPLGIEIAGEGKPFINSPSKKGSWSKVSIAAMSFGYEVTMTPLQILSFYNAIANNGVMVKPMFVKEISYAGKTIERFDPEIINPSICSPAVLDTIKSLLEGVVVRGTAKSLSNTVYGIAGKTGTAQIAQGKRGYNKKDYNASFVGYFPAKDPKYSCIVYVNRPKSGKIYGGSVAAPVFKEIADKVYAAELDIHDYPEFMAAASLAAPPQTTGKASELGPLLAGLGYNITWDTVQQGWVSTFAYKQEIMASLRDFNETNMPDVVGMTARDAMYIMEKKGLKVNLKGKGKVKYQSVPPGGRVRTGTGISLELSTL
jgi:cell division protein FtsI (penicillin-binding protein 3)